MDYAEFSKMRGMVDRSAGKPQDGQKPEGHEELDDELDIKEKQGSLIDLNKANLIKFAETRGLYDQSYDKLKPTAIVSIILEKARLKVVEASLKTTEEAASLAEDELFALFDTISGGGK
jgi:hypothetical protein